MERQILKCTKCQATFELRKEFERCPECRIGFLVGGHFARTGESAISDLFDSGGYVDPSEFYRQDSTELLQEHPMCHCHQVPVLSPWNLRLSTDDIDSQRFTTCTIDAEDAEPGKITTETINKMSRIFAHTFGE